LARPDGLQKILPTKLIAVLKKLTTDCEKTANSLSKLFRHSPSFYFRFNVIRGAEGISFEEWKRWET
ncbi:hypothetical protein K469DRAFT_589972, partial [Zopfia rhizophila CBS 207.26]